MSDPVLSAYRERSRLETAFTGPLRDAVARVPGARGAVFLDGEGEAVDEVAQIPTMEIRILGAHLGILVALFKEHAAILGAPQELVLETERATLVVRAIDERYIVALEAGPEASLGLLRRELAAAVDRIRAELA